MLTAFLIWQVLTGSDGPEEALLKRCAHFDLEGNAKTAAQACDAIIATRRKQLELCSAELVRQVCRSHASSRLHAPHLLPSTLSSVCARLCVCHTAELVRQVAFARDAIAKFEGMYPLKSLSEKDAASRASPADNFRRWLEEEVKECGDVDANARMVPLIKEGKALPPVKVAISDKEKGFKDRMAWTRDQVHLLRRLQKEVTGRVRSLRFFENVRTLQREQQALREGGGGGGGGSPSKRSPGGASPAKRAKKGACGGGGEHLALLSCCGHIGELKAVRRAASEQVCVKAEQGCKAPARSACVIAVGELGAESGGVGGTYGAKLASIVGLVKRIPKDEKVRASCLPR